MERIHGDIRRIHETGFFRDVQVDVKESGNGKAVTFVVFEQPVIRAIYLSGARKVKTEDLRKVLTIRANQVFNVKGLNESTDALRKLYVSNGYYAVKIDPRTEDGELGVQVRFIIDEPRDKAFVRKIVF